MHWEFRGRMIRENYMETVGMGPFWMDENNSKHRPGSET